ncbi:hypothetical protein FOZ63_021147, partial [Perkinsus olseni]
MSPHGFDPADPRTRRYTSILTATCAVSKFTWLRCMHSYTVNEIIKNLDILLGDIGYPIILVFDGAATQTPWTTTSQYQKLKAWGAKKAIQIAILPPYARGYAGWYEACHRFVRKALQADFLTGSEPEAWPERIAHFQLIMNSTPYDSQSSLCPLYLFYAYAGRIPCDVPSDPTEDLSNLVSGVQHLLNPVEQEFLTKLHAESVAITKTQFSDYQLYWKKQKEIQQAALQRKYGAAQTPSFKEGDLVLVFTPSKERACPDFSGPFRIVECISPSTCKILPVGGHSASKDISPIQLYANLT